MKFFNLFQFRFLIIVLLNTGVTNANAQMGNSSFVVDVSRPGVALAPIGRGQQIEEFNHQFEGGLYAQLISNPSFEEVDSKVLPRSLQWKDTPLANWSLIKKGNSDGVLAGQTSEETKMLNNNQGHCIKLAVNSVASGPVGIANGGYWGIKLENNTKYKVSFWARKGSGFKGTIQAKLEGIDGKVYGQSQEFKPAEDWKHFTCEITTRGISKVTGENRFVLYATSTGDVYFDVITVMPPTWKNRSNGLRPDLGEKLAGLKLKYLQFPGGCDSECSNLDTCRNWKNSIGPIEERRGSTRARWDYKNDLYFGLDEFYQLCEDLSAEPVYTVPSGISETPHWGPHSICPIDKMQPIIGNILDLLEYSNGPVTSKWGSLRARNGHPQPYHLKFLEIGNENGTFTVSEYRQRYVMIRDSIKAHYPTIQFMFNDTHVSGLKADFVDEHFYRKDLSDQYSRYDTLDFPGRKICVAEYASSIEGNGGDAIGNYGDALNDAIFMLGCEKNSAKLWWTGYGNYAGYLGHSNFGPCLVWNDAVSCFATPAYYMQKMLFTDNMGTRLLPFTSKTDCYGSASIDTESGRKDVLIKIVNKKNAPETVKIILEGAQKVNSKGYSTTLTGALNDENTLSAPNKIIPVEKTFNAGSNFSYIFPANSITVLRVNIQK
jgi:alpha-L-arabinofuranosidase